MKLLKKIIAYFENFRIKLTHRMISPSILKQDSLLYWRVNILAVILSMGMVLSTLALLTTIPLAIQERFWKLIIFDSLGFFIGLTLLFSPKIRYRIRATISLLMFYIIGLNVITSVGPLSGGPIWLFTFAILVGILLGIKAAILATLLNGVTLTAFTWVISSGLIGQHFPFFPSPQALVVALVNFLILNLLASVSLSVLVKGLVYSHQKEKILSQNLFLAKQKLEVEIEEHQQAEEEKKYLERQLQQAGRMQAIGILAGGVAHDLNNVLSGMVSYPDLLIMQLPKDSSLIKPLKIIQKSGEKAATIVEDLLTLARRGITISEVINLNSIIEDYLQSPEYKLLYSTHPNITMTTDLKNDLLDIKASPIHLFKTIMNLTSNAAEAILGGGKILITTENRYIDKPIKGYDRITEGDYVVLSISDSGAGISPQEMEQIFEPFYTKKIMGRSGTGLGMAVVWGTVKDHKGYIDLQSTKGKGTTFTLYFPATRTKKEGHKTTLSLEDYQGEGQSILVVDDINEQLEIASTLLTKLGYSVNTLSSGKDAIEYLRNKSVDLIILDMIMDPGIDGLETFKQIIRLHPDQKVILASGFSETERVKEAISLGVGQYIKKPYTLQKIGSAVKNELKKQPKFPNP